MQKEISYTTTASKERISHYAQSSFYLFFKHIIDVILSFVFLILFSPLILLIAIVIKLTSKGPVIFSQNLAVGKNGKLFTLYKFRTMYTNSNDNVHREAIKNFVNGKILDKINDKNGPQNVYKLLNDRRITPIGNLLRQTGFDEIPQFFNVLKGEMSIVGPRPPLLYEYELYDAKARQRLSVLPGITGLYQIMARSQVTFKEMIEFDLNYIKKCNLLLDFKIILRTPWVMITGKGAH